MVGTTFSLANLEYFLMVFVRVATFVYIAPFFGTANTPHRVKVGFSFFTAAVVYQVLPKEVLRYSTEIEYAILILKEGITGLLIGFAANICNSIIIFSGRMIDMDIGLSMVTLFDPVSREQTSISGSFYSYLLLITLMVTNMHHYILRALTDVYQLIPVGGLSINMDGMYNSMLGFMTDFIVIGFRIALPVFAVSLILNAVLGILAKVAPQLNMFVVGMQLKILVGLLIIFLTIGLLPSISNFISTEMKKMMVSFIEVMY